MGGRLGKHRRMMGWVRRFYCGSVGFIYRLRGAVGLLSRNSTWAATIRKVLLRIFPVPNVEGIEVRMDRNNKPMERTNEPFTLAPEKKTDAPSTRC